MLADVASVRGQAWVTIQTERLPKRGETEHCVWEEGGREGASQAASHRMCQRPGIKTEGHGNSKAKGFRENGRTSLRLLRWHHPLKFTSVLELWDRQWLSQFGHCRQYRDGRGAATHHLLTVTHATLFPTSEPLYVLSQHLGNSLPRFSQSCLLLSLLAATQMSLYGGHLSRFILISLLIPVMTRVTI